ncbi:MAG: alpha/beta hydrolase [Rhizobiaceae bacterium]|nr:alpha/beta hydrolase [Rhizobiaceae bacterium]
MEHVTSADGTTIAFERAGSGPSLVLVHGTSASRARWGNIRPLLEKHFTVFAMDRRGRGGSGEVPAGAAYALEREYEDVAAVVAAAGEPVILFGHSYGGVCSLGAHALTDRLAALILYEAPVLEGNGPPPELLARFDAAVTADDREAVMKMFCEEVVRMRPSDIAALRASPAWPARLAAAPTIPRELRAAGDFPLAAAKAERIKVPTLLLHGGDSPDFFKVPMSRLAAAIPHASVVALEGQQHVAMDTAPEMLTRIVVDFWREVRGAG